MLCVNGVVSATWRKTWGIMATVTLSTRSRDTAAGSEAAMIALTMATPSRDLEGARHWEMTGLMLEALMPPMQTVGMEP